MARTAHAKSVEEVLERYESGERDFSGIHLQDAGFGSVNLDGSNFSGATLWNADFLDADLRDICFDGANLSQLSAVNVLSLAAVSVTRGSSLLSLSGVSALPMISAMLT